MQYPARRAAALGAVLALPLSALAVTPASAGPLSAQPGSDRAVFLVSQPGGAASTADDGTNTTVRLEAFGGPSVSRIRFEYTTDPSQFGDQRRITVIDTVPRNDDGAFAVEWSPGSFPLGVYIRAVAIDGSGTAYPADASERMVDVGSSRAVNVTNGSSKGYFVQPYSESRADTQLQGVQDRTLVVVSGTLGTSSTAGAAAVGWLQKQRASDGSTRFSQVNPQSTESSKGGAFTVAVPIADGGTGGFQDYDLTGDPDQIAMQATIGDVDDVEAFTLYEQRVVAVNATANRTTVAPGEKATVTVTVLDQDNAPIAGAQVVNAKNASEVRYTDPTGRATFELAPGSTQYYVNTTDEDAYSFNDDKLSNEVTVTSSSSSGQPRLAATSADGPAFDLDEVDNTQSQTTGMPPLNGSQGDGDPTDVTVQLQNASGAATAPASGQSLGYYWTVTPFGGGQATRFPASGTDTGVHEGGGKYSVKVPSGGNGTYELFAQLSNDPVTGVGVPVAKVLTVKAGQAEVQWDKQSPEIASAGSTYTATGRLALPDGTTLPGRALNLTFQRDTATTDEDPTPDAGFDGPGSTTTTTLAVVTDASGAFAAPLEDPAESPQRSELGGNIDAASAANDKGNAGASRNDHVVNFVHNPTPAALQLAESREGATLRPGEYTLYTARVVNAQGGGVAGQTVTLTTDDGYFSKQDGSATAPTPATTASGAEVGAYRNDGTTVTLTTGSDGTARVFLAMGREAGFDDDGAVQTTVGASSGAFRASDGHAWTSANPLNGGEVVVAPATGDQDSGILPEAQTADQVRLDVTVTDAFGNPVAGEDVTLSDDSSTGTIGETDGTANDGRIVSDLDKTGDVVLTSTSGTAQRLTASWTTETTTYAGSSSSTTTGSETLTDDYTVGWYVVDREDSTYSLVREGAATRPVGSAVTVTYRALDQKGQPVPDLFVNLDRTGPGAATGSTSGLTGQDGVVTHTFAGTREGRATVVGSARVGSASGEAVDGSTRSTSVTFGPDGPRAIDVTLSGASNGRKDDRLTVRTSPAAAGAVVKLFRIGSDGRRTLVDRSTVSAKGTRVFTVKDGLRTATTYVAKVVRNKAVRGATSNTRTVR